MGRGRENERWRARTLYQIPLFSRYSSARSCMFNCRPRSLASAFFSPMPLSNEPSSHSSTLLSRSDLSLSIARNSPVVLRMGERKYSFLIAISPSLRRRLSFGDRISSIIMLYQNECVSEYESARQGNFA